MGKAVNLGNPYSKNFPNGYRERRKAYNAVIALGASIVPKAEEPKPTLGVIEKVILDVLAKENLINVQRSVVTGDPKLVTTSIANVLNHFSQQVMEIKSSALSKTDVQLFEATVDDLLETLRARNAN